MSRCVKLRATHINNSSAYPHSKRDDFQHTLNAKQSGERGVHVMQRLLVKDALLVVLIFHQVVDHQGNTINIIIIATKKSTWTKAVEQQQIS